MEEEIKTTPESNPVPAPEQAAPLTNQQKTALLRYLAILFAVAFLLVLISLFVQSHNSRQTLSEISKNNTDVLTNALANAEALQTQNRELQDENAALRAQLQEQEDLLNERDTLLVELETRLDAALRENEDQTALQSQLETVRKTYDALVTALTCTTHEGNLTFSKAMDVVEQNLDVLSESARKAYENLLEE